jgi:hypothetical protein
VVPFPASRRQCQTTHAFLTCCTAHSRAQHSGPELKLRPQMCAWNLRLHCCGIEKLMQYRRRHAHEGMVRGGHSAALDIFGMLLHLAKRTTLTTPPPKNNPVGP